MNRDTNELPLIMAELEESADAIDTQQYVSTHVIIYFALRQMYLIKREVADISRNISKPPVSSYSHP